MFKSTRLIDQVRAGVGCVRVGECVKYLKREGVEQKRGKEKQNLKKKGGGDGTSWVKGWGTLKKGALEPPYEL